jgi:hypothetical protein
MVWGAGPSSCQMGLEWEVAGEAIDDLCRTRFTNYRTMSSGRHDLNNASLHIYMHDTVQI